jgi:pyruvate dehydrogenase E1 component alpha subunit
MNTTYEITEKMNEEALRDIYRQMRLIRVFEERAGEQYMLGKIRGFLHLYIGQEAVAAGAISALQPQDYIATHYRDHGHALARGLDPKAVMAELFGKATGTSNGMGGSMHLFDASLNFAGGYAIVGAQMPIAVGLAFAATYKGDDNVVVCFLGDGALNEGEFHESMNLAAIWKLPLLFLCENNLYGMGTPVEDVFAKREIYQVAQAYDMPSRQVDGMDVLAVREATEAAIESMRAGQGPFFLEALTYRFRGHSIADPSEYRTRAEERLWQQEDPITCYKDWLLNRKLVTEDDVAAMDHEVESQVEEALQFAEDSPPPPPEALFQNVYADS